MKPRAATVSDAPAIAGIYNEGIDDRIATFETRHRIAEDVVQWLDGRHPVVVVEDDGGAFIAFAATSHYRPRDCYAGIAEFSVYAARAARGRGAGRMAMEALFIAACTAGSGSSCRECSSKTPPAAASPIDGFREVGVYERHGQLTACGGMWCIVEKLLT